MQTSAEYINDQTQIRLGKVQEWLNSGTSRQAALLLNGLRPVEIARVLQSSPPVSRNVIWSLLDKEIKGDVIEELPQDIQNQFLRHLDAEEFAELAEGFETDNLVDVLQHFPEKVTQEVLSAMSTQDRERVEKIIAYDEDTAGGLTNTDTITVRPRFSLDVVLRYLRRHPNLPRTTDCLFVVNRKDSFLGTLPLSTILTNDPNVSVREVMVTDANAIPASMSDIEVTKLFEQNDWISAPVVNDQGKLIGRITIDDVVDVIREEADHSLMSLAGLDEEDDTFASATRTIPRRAIWLGINLLTALLASSVINLFQETIDKVVALAVLMPIVASMGGVAGSQTLTVVIRGMATGEIGKNNFSWLLSREIRVGFVNGVLWAIVMGIIAAMWFNDHIIAVIIATAMIVNLIVGAFGGVLLPRTLRLMNIDPALAGGVTLTTITDIVGFFTFLGLATYFYGG